MKTIFSIVMLIIFGVIVSFLSLYLLNIAGLPGALLAGAPGKHSKRRFIFGSIVSALGQSYVYLTFTAFIVNWTMLAARREDVVGFVVWPVAFFAVFIPIWLAHGRANTEAREQKSRNAQVEALGFTFLVSLLGFFVFAFVPSVMRAAWGWLPYMK
ncbi:MAG: hypothetical protein JXA50_09845 [Deltaproteobacteria bacterium]|nr:hypothetical protein [Deltaproteobacteria bacterium]